MVPRPPHPPGDLLSCHEDSDCFSCSHLFTALQATNIEYDLRVSTYLSSPNSVSDVKNPIAFSYSVHFYLQLNFPDFLLPEKLDLLSLKPGDACRLVFGTFDIP